jgi:maleate isomerase
MEGGSMAELESVNEWKPRSINGWRAEVGMIAPISGMYREWEAVAPEGIRFSDVVLGMRKVTPEGLKQMVKIIEDEAKKLTLGRKKDLICFGCTAGSFIGGPGYDQMLIEKIEKATNTPATTTATCMLELLRDMGIKKIVLVGPYIDSIFDVQIKFLEANGIKTLATKGLGFSEVTEYWNYYMDPYLAYRIAKEGAKAALGADCVFSTCIMSNVVPTVDILEKEIGKPVISSLSSTLYGILKKLGIPDPVYHYGEALVRPRM